MLDIIIVGNGPAGLSAAITARARGKTVAIISNSVTDSGLYKARDVPNYPGLPGISGAELLTKMTEHAAELGADFRIGQVNTLLPTETGFCAGFGADMLVSSCLILATGIIQTSLFPGEAELLGNGVSYCATCDGMLFRGKRVCVVCHSPGSAGEADFLSSIGCDVTRLETHNIIINGDSKVRSVTADGKEFLCDCVFILRQAIAPQLLLPGLETAGGHISTGVGFSTNLRGVFAAGDCTGKPYQIAKAVGEGQVAALSAVEYLTQSISSEHNTKRKDSSYEFITSDI